MFVWCQKLYIGFFLQIMLSVPLPFLTGKEVLRKINTKIVGFVFYHSSGRTPNFSVHQWLCLKCIKERRSRQHTETWLYCCAVGVCLLFCMWRSRSIVITKACLAQTVLLLEVRFPKFLFCSVGWMQLDWYESDKIMRVLYWVALFACQHEFWHRIKIAV